MRKMTKLSPTAQAVHDAAFLELPDGLCLKAALAAALRAVADQVVPVTRDAEWWFAGNCCEKSMEIARNCVHAELFAIATELEA